MGQVLSTLKKLGIDKNTIILLTSDNGPVVDDGYADQAVELLGNHKPSGPLRGNKYSSFEGGTRVPFIVTWPENIRKGQTSEALVSQIDLFQSFAQLLNATLPKGACPDSRGHWSSLVGEDNVGCPYVIEQNLWNVLSVRTLDWKYIEPSNGNSYMQLTNIETGNNPEPQLYNMEQSFEEINIASQHPEIVELLQSILKQERSK